MSKKFTGGTPSTNPMKGMRCYDTHPVLQLGGGVFAGGSCLNPVHLDANLYIGFERGMAVVTGDYEKGGPQHIFHGITDMRAPSDPVAFKKLVDFTAVKLAEGWKVHAGCIGGHGRTGTFLSALVKITTGEEDAITWVRENYCQKAVESHDQVVFLSTHFGIKSVKGHKEFTGEKAAPGAYGSAWPYSNQQHAQKSLWPGKGGGSSLPPPPKAVSGVAFKDHKRFDPVPSVRNVLKAGIL